MSTIRVDTVAEYTSANGITIDGVNIKDSKITTANSIDSDVYVDGSIDTAHIADDQITLAKMAGGTDGNIISYDASGDPVAIATGSDGQVLTSTGAGSPPAFEAVSAGGTLTSKSATTSGSSVDITGIPAGTKWITMQLYGVGANGTGLFGVCIGDSGGIETSGYTGQSAGINTGSVAATLDMGSQFNFVSPSISAKGYNGIIHLRLFEASSYTWVMSGLVSDDGGGDTTFFSSGGKVLTAELTQIRIMTADTFDEGNVSIQYGE